MSFRSRHTTQKVFLQAVRLATSLKKASSKKRFFMIRIVPVVYNPITQSGCFEEMFKDTSNDDVLFFYNENVLDWLDWTDSTSGAGSAKIRPRSWSYHQDKPVRVLGIPTGFSSASRGFTTLDRDTREAISFAIQRAIVLIRQNPAIKRIMFPADKDNTKLLGTKVFQVDDAVVRHISNAIWKIPELVAGDFQPKPLDVLRRKELDLLPRAKLEEKYALLLQAEGSRKRQATTSSAVFMKPTHQTLLRRW